MPIKTKIGTEVAHVTRDSVTTFKVKRSNLRAHSVRTATKFCTVIKLYVRKKYSVDHAPCPAQNFRRQEC